MYIYIHNYIFYTYICHLENSLDVPNASILALHDQCVLKMSHVTHVKCHTCERSHKWNVCR